MAAQVAQRDHAKLRNYQTEHVFEGDTSRGEMCLSHIISHGPSPSVELERREVVDHCVNLPGTTSAFMHDDAVMLNDLEGKPSITLEYGWTVAKRERMWARMNSSAIICRYRRASRSKKAKPCSRVSSRICPFGG